MPEFLEHRYGSPARTLMATYMMVAYVGVAIAAVLYSGALGLATIFDLNLYTGIWLIGLLAGAYTIYGGLKAVVWSDLLQGVALLLGGALVTWLALGKVGGLGAFTSRGQLSSLESGSQISSTGDSISSLHSAPWARDHLPPVSVASCWRPRSS
jgi:SSS family solute:Na+ symporter